MSANTRELAQRVAADHRVRAAIIAAIRDASPTLATLATLAEADRELADALAGVVGAITVGELVGETTHRERLLAAMRAEPARWWSSSQLRSVAGGHRWTVQASLASLEAVGRVRRTGRTGGTRWRLVEDPEVFAC